MKVVEREGRENLMYSTDRWEHCIIYDDISLVKDKLTGQWGVVGKKGLFIVYPRWSKIEVLDRRHLKATDCLGNVTIFDLEGNPILQTNEYADVQYKDGRLIAMMKLKEHAS